MRQTMNDPQRLQDLLKLPAEERLRLARWLIESAEPGMECDDAPRDPHANGLLALAGRYEGGPGNTAERAEEILESEVDSAQGLTTR
ncbi:MAG TPA: hypothetical protein VN687_05770 [Blastocatellia bacterium]|nr:hypothetical protein [Blastocatellia bacterium]